MCLADYDDRVRTNEKCHGRIAGTEQGVSPDYKTTEVPGVLLNAKIDSTIEH